jgi:transcriptional regulator with XRE-family HTH domain
VPPRRKLPPRSPEHAALGEAIRQIRARRDLSQEALADKADLHLTQIGGMERGTRNPSYATLVRLAKALRVKPGEIVNLADELLARGHSRPKT